MRHGDPVDHDSTVFPLRHHGSDPVSTSRDGALCCPYGIVRDRYSWDKDRVDLRILPASQIAVLPVHLLSGIMDRDNPHAGSVLLFRSEKVYTTVKNR